MSTLQQQRRSSVVAMQRGLKGSVNQARLADLFDEILDDETQATMTASQNAMFKQFDTDKELTFEDFWEMIISPNNEHPEFQANLQFALVEQDIRESAAYALKEMFLWVHRMVCIPFETTSLLSLSPLSLSLSLHRSLLLCI